MHPTPESQLFHSIWRSIREQFLLPQCICTHSGRTFTGNGKGCGEHNGCSHGRVSRRRVLECCREGIPGSSWEVYDFSQAGCVLCGSLHVCMDGRCMVEKNDQGHEICIITGLCVKMLNFSSEEFVDTACMGSTSFCSFPAGCGMDGVEDMCTQDFADDENEVYGERHLDPFSAPGLDHESTQEHKEGNSRCAKRARTNGNASQAAAPAMSAAKTACNKGLHCTSKKERATACGGVRSSVNKKNRYRSWVYQRVMQPKLLALQHQHRQGSAHGAATFRGDIRQSFANKDGGTEDSAVESCQAHWSWIGRSAVGAANARQQQEQMHHNNPSLGPFSPIHKGSLSDTEPLAATQSIRNKLDFHHHHQLHNQLSASNIMKSDRIHNLIQIYVSEVLCSSKWKKSMQMEVRIWRIAVQKMGLGRNVIWHGALFEV